jgi:hypothetical protein
MSNEHEEQVPGITFWFKNATTTGALTGDLKFMVDLTLTCGVTDEELWEDILNRFKDKAGFRVFSSNDFHIEVADVMRQTIEELRTEKIRLEAELRQKSDELTRTKGELEGYRVPLSAFGAALRGGQ